MKRMIIFDDGQAELGPMTDLRAAFEVRTGMHLTSARLDAWRPRTLAGYWAPEHLRAVARHRWRGADRQQSDDPPLPVCHRVCSRSSASGCRF